MTTNVKCSILIASYNYERYLVHGISSVGEGGGTVNHSSQLAVSKVKMWLGVTALLLASIDIGLRSEAPIARVITKVRIEFSRCYRRFVLPSIRVSPH